MTHDQLARIDKLPEECRVIGRYMGNPVISYPDGYMQVVDHTGRLRRASTRARREVDGRRLERAVLQSAEEAQAYMLP